MDKEHIRYSRNTLVQCISLLILLGSTYGCREKVTNVSINGPDQIEAGKTGTYTVQVTLDKKVEGVRSFDLSIMEYDSDSDNDKLVDKVNVVVRRDKKQGTKTFKLECTDADSGLVLRGSDGFSNDDNEDNVHEVFAKMTWSRSNKMDSDWKEIECVEVE